MKKIKVYPMKSKTSGLPVVNQFIIYEKTPKTKIFTFQSYDTIICKVVSKIGEFDKIILDDYALEYSRTTSKYLYNFLDTFSIIHLEAYKDKAGERKKQILQAIKDKEIQIKNLN